MGVQDTRSQVVGDNVRLVRRTFLCTRAEAIKYMKGSCPKAEAHHMAEGYVEWRLYWRQENKKIFQQVAFWDTGELEVEIE